MTAIEQYRQEVNKFPRLSPEQEKDLAVRAQAGDEQAREDFINANLRLVFAVAARFMGRGLDFADLVMEGNVGLMRAVEDFDTTKGFRFSTYAYSWIFQTIHRAVENLGRAVRLPVHVQSDMRRVAKVKSALRNELGREASNAEIAEAMALQTEQVEGLLTNYMEAVRLDSPVKEDSDETLGDLMPSSTPTPEQIFMNMARKAEIQKAVGTLREIPAQVITMLYGLDGGEPKTLEQAGQVLGYTKERIRQIQREALGRLSLKLEA